MREFSEMRIVSGTKEFKKAQKLYNKLMSVFVEYEAQYKAAWSKSLDALKAGMNATLLVRHPKTNQLVVNFDISLKALIRNAKWLFRLG